MLRRVFHSGQAPAGLNRVFYQDAGVVRLIEAAAVAVDEQERRACFSKVQQLIADDMPHVGLWYKANVAVCQPDIQGVQRSPIAAFTFLKDVRRSRDVRLQ